MTSSVVQPTQLRLVTPLLAQVCSRPEIPGPSHGFCNTDIVRLQCGSVSIVSRHTASTCAVLNCASELPSLASTQGGYRCGRFVTTVVLFGRLWSNCMELKGHLSFTSLHRQWSLWRLHSIRAAALCRFFGGGCVCCTSIHSVNTCAGLGALALGGKRSDATMNDDKLKVVTGLLVANAAYFGWRAIKCKKDDDSSKSDSKKK